MSINLSAPQVTELKPRIVVIGVGGAGGNAVNNMITSGLEGVDFIVANTDAQALAQSQAERQIQLGATITQGLGCGARPDVGRAAAEEAIDQIVDHLGGAHMAFITAGMGGGTGTGAAPVIAEALRDQGVLTVGVVTKPFHFEGRQRMSIAEGGIENLQAFVDTLIIIPNQNLFRIANEKTTFAEAFALADNVLHAGVRGITDLMVMPGLINLDFNDVKTVMSEMGKAMMGTGEAEGERRAIEAAEAAIANPLLDDVSMKGAKGVLINITGGMDLTLYEVDEAANRIREEVDPDANIIVGSALEDGLSGRMRVSLVATGIDAEACAQRPSNVTPRLAAIGGRALPEKSDAEAGSASAETMATSTLTEPADATVMETSAGVDVTTTPASATAGPAAAVAMPMPEPMTAAAPAELTLPEVAEMAAPETAAEEDVEEAAVAEPDLLKLDEREQVPTPKPYQPARDPLDVETKAPDDAAVPEAKPFIAPEPMVPPRSMEPLGRPNSWAESGAAGDTASAEPKKARGLAARLWRRSTTGQETEAPVATAPAMPAATISRPAQPSAAAVGASTERTQLTQDSKPPAPVAPPAPPAAPMQPAERLSAGGDDDDLLEIPSFLRRQAN